MERKIRKKEPVLLPLYFKKIGISVMILAVVSAITLKLVNVKLEQTENELFRVLMLNAFILGLLLLALSRDKVEDEMTISIRLKAMSWSFVWAVFFVIISPIIDVLFNDPIGFMTGQQVVTSMLIVYLIMYYLQKMGR